MSAPLTGEQEALNVQLAMRENELVFGRFIAEFESILCKFCDASYAVGVSSGTAALHLALRAAGVQAGEAVIVPTLTFIAPANAVRYVGAWPVFMGSDDYWQIDPDKVASFFESECEHRAEGLFERFTGRRISAIIGVHYLGHPCDIPALKKLSDPYGITVIEDAAQGLGSELRERPAGSMADFACLSFFPNKLITAAGGGMVLTRLEKDQKKIRYWANQAKDDALLTAHDEIGFNYRLTNIQAAIGVAQAETLLARVKRKQEIRRIYAEAFEGVLGIRMQPERHDAVSANWLSCVEIKAEEFGKDALSVVRSLRERGIEAHPGYQPLHLSKAHQGSQFWDCNSAEQMVKESICLPCSLVLTKEDQQFVIDQVLASRS